MPKCAHPPYLDTPQGTSVTRQPMSKRHEACYEVARACMVLEGEEDRTRMRTNHQNPKLQLTGVMGVVLG